MSAFSDSIKKGLQAAEIARSVKAEINEVFYLANKAMLAETDNKIGIKITRLPRLRTHNQHSKFLNIGAASVAANLGLGNPPEVELNPHYSIALVGKPPAIEISRWRQSETGYPCWIITDTREVSCSDKASLMNALEELLASPSTGEALHTALNR